MKANAVSGWVQSKETSRAYLKTVAVRNQRVFVAISYAACVTRMCPSVLDGFTWDANVERLPLPMLLYLM